VTCAAQAIEDRADEDGIHMMLVLRYYATLILESDRPGPHSQAVRRARDIGIRVISLLRYAMVAAGGPRYSRLLLAPACLWAMTAKGNEHAQSDCPALSLELSGDFQVHRLHGRRPQVATLRSEAAPLVKPLSRPQLLQRRDRAFAISSLA
jgi:hypothetical protein